MSGPVFLTDKNGVAITTNGVGTNTLDVSGTITPSGTQDVNLTEVAGAAVATGHGTAAGAIRVELPTDGTGQVAISQATPGTTNGVYVTGGTLLYQRPATATVAFTPGSSAYAVGQVIGPTGAGLGVLTLAMGIGNNTKFTFGTIRLVIPVTAATTVAAMTGFLFESAPASTYTDAAIPTVGADSTKLIAISLASAATVAATSTVVLTLAALTGQSFTTDASGNIYIVISSAGTTAWTASAAATLRAQVFY